MRRVSKSRARRHYPKPSRASEGKLLDAIAARILEPTVEEQKQASLATPLLRKQHIDSDIDDELQPKQDPLTRRNLALFNKASTRLAGLC